jgi:hypothetical protein
MPSLFILQIARRHGESSERDAAFGQGHTGGTPKSYVYLTLASIEASRVIHVNARRVKSRRAGLQFGLQDLRPPEFTEGRTSRVGLESA